MQSRPGGRLRNEGPGGGCGGGATPRRDVATAPESPFLVRFGEAEPHKKKSTDALDNSLAAAAKLRP
jgi:hypothetical protein